MHKNKLSSAGPVFDTVSPIHSQHEFRYIPGFDTLRGFAVFLVLLLHCSYGFFKGGRIGVDLFFVLSGYLITSLLQNECLNTGKISIPKFYARRVLRLLPPLLLCVILANLLWSSTTLYPGAIRSQATLGALFYFTNFFPGVISGNMTHLWSLAVEEHFYLFWPLIVSVFLFKILFRNRLVFIFAMILAVSIFRIYAYHVSLHFANGAIVIDPYRFTLCRIDGILVGAAMAVMLAQPGSKKFSISNSTATLILGSLLLVFTGILFTLEETNSYWCNGGFIFTNLVCAAAVFMAIKRSDHFLLSNKISHWLGKRSYGIYVYHFPIFLAMEGLRKDHSMTNFLLVTILRFTATIILAELSFRYIEKPVLGLKKKFAVAE